MNSQLIHTAIEKCRKITQLSSTTFYFGSLLFPKQMQDAVWTLYAFCRTTDDLIDVPSPLKPWVAEDKNIFLRILDSRRALIDHIFSGITQSDLTAYLQKTNFICTISDRDVFVALLEMISRYPLLSKEMFYKLIDGVEMDISYVTYKTYSDLFVYCDKVAGVVGEMICAVSGVDNRDAIEYAKKLGNAMQITNILRDVGDDMSRCRLYLPQDELSDSKIDIYSIAESYTSHTTKKNSEIYMRYASFMQKQIVFNHRLYSDAAQGYHFLPKNIVIPVRVAARMYESILDSIEKNNYDVFTQRARVKKRTRAQIFLKEMNIPLFKTI